MVQTHSGTQTHTHTDTLLNKHVLSYMHTHTHTQTHTHTLKHTCVFMHAYSKRIHTQTHTTESLSHLDPFNLHTPLFKQFEFLPLEHQAVYQMYTSVLLKLIAPNLTRW